METENRNGVNNENLCLLIRTKNYLPQPILEKFIPKDNSKTRLLGISTTVDRILQQAIFIPPLLFLFFLSFPLLRPIHYEALFLISFSEVNLSNTQQP